jgi:hypothetical protein
MNPTITQAIMNLPPVDQQDPVKWVETLRNMNKTDDQIAQALQAWVSEAGPQSWQDLLNLHQTDPTHVAAWLAVMDPTTKLRVTQEIEQIIATHSSASPATISAQPKISNKILTDAINEIQQELTYASDTLRHPGIVAHIKTVLTNKIKSHPNKEKKLRLTGKSAIEQINDLIASSSLTDKLKTDLYKAVSNARQPITESQIPHIPIGKTILAQMNIK